MPSFDEPGLTLRQRFLKRALDIFVALLGLIATSWIILVAATVARFDTGESGFFMQRRIGRFGRSFRIVKIRTMRSHALYTTTVTTSRDPRITAYGRLLRKLKIDELPQLLNVLLGDMSLVGPRPDVEGSLDTLTGPDRILLTVRPGITGPATLRFRNEEAELARQPDPESYNSEVIFPEKVRLNREYVEHYTMTKDLCYLVATLFGVSISEPAVGVSNRDTRAL
jgi:lipopolysaccharide/colanic/teichoic acid biosynthesis glycosyltransferase